MKISLTGCGWFDEPPKGNRLLWSYPCHESDGQGASLGLPDTLKVYRAPLTSDKSRLLVSEKSTVKPVLEGSVPRLTVLNFPVQAMTFVYRGEDAVLIACDSSNKPVASRRLENGKSYVLSGAEILTLWLFSPFGYFEEVQTLSLPHDIELDWEEIAEIKVKESLNSSLDQVKSRYVGSVTMGEEEWSDLRDQALRAQYTSGNEVPDAEDASWQMGEVSAWQILYLKMNSRWEYAVLFGHGFSDGPHGALPEIDEIYPDRLFQSESDRSNVFAYKISEPAGRVDDSNIAVCLSESLSPLPPPEKSRYLHPKVRLETNPGRDKPELIARYELKWQNTFDNPHDAGTALVPPSGPSLRILVAGTPIGVEIEEEIFLPRLTGSSRPIRYLFDSYICRSRLPDDSFFGGTQFRQIKAPDHRLKLRCRARAIDGWDRVSQYSAWSDWTAFQLHHEANAPALTAARYGAGRAILTREIRWEPDLIVKSDRTAKLLVYRRKLGSRGRPVSRSVVLSDPVRVQSGEGNLYKASVFEGPVSQDFLNGYLAVPPFSAMITQIDNQEIYFAAANLLFSAGPGKLQQNPKHPDLWEKVYEFDANALSRELEFPDPVPEPNEEADVLSYLVRLSYHGLQGPASNIIQTFRIPKPPQKPEPFTIEVLGEDFYHRTMVKICFAQPVDGGTYTVWWADSEDLVSKADFEKAAVPGEYRAQQPYENLYLFDVLSIPIPQESSKKIMIGVQRVNKGGGQSKFEVTEKVLQAK